MFGEQSHGVEGGLSNRRHLGAYLFLLILATGAIFYVALSLNQSSIGVWEEIYPSRPVKQSIDLGVAKHIRSDEWNTLTPWVLGQATNGFATRNPSVGGEAAEVVTGIPTSSPLMAFQPKFYGFFIFEKERGFSWLWAYKTFGLLASAFFFFYLTTNFKVLLSIAGTIWVYLSSPTQWWFSSHLPEQLIGFFCCASGVVLMFQMGKSKLSWLGAGLLAFGSITSLMHAYPPFQVPLAIIGIGIAVFAAADGKLRSPLQWGRRQYYTASGVRLCVVAIVVATVAGAYLSAAYPAIEALQNTIYPGMRRSIAGEVTVPVAFSGIFSVFSQNETVFPKFLGNSCEASLYYIVPPLFLISHYKKVFTPRFALVRCLLVSWLILFVWCCVALPDSLGAIFAKSGLSSAPGMRALVGLGINSILLTIASIASAQDAAETSRSGKAHWIISIVAWVGLVGIFMAFAMRLRGLDGNFYVGLRLVVGVVLLSSIHFAGAMGKGWLLLPALLGVAPNLSINPLVSGISSISEKPILKAARNQTYDYRNRWVVMGDFIMSQGLKAEGLNVATGSMFLPNRLDTKVLDPQKKYATVWNRYAHVVMTSKPGIAEPKFELRTPDSYVVSIDVCGPQLDTMGVTRVAYTESVPTADLACLDPLYSPADSKVRLFIRNATVTGSRSSL